MRVQVISNLLVFMDPIYACKSGVKIFYTRKPDAEAEALTKPVATADLEKGTVILDLPEADIDILAIHVKQPKYKFFPFFFYQWQIAHIV